MKMIQTYQGYFQEDGQFIADNLLVKIPVNKRVIINILDDEVSHNKIFHQRRVDMLDEILANALRVEEQSNLHEEDWNDFENLRSKSTFSREIYI